MAKKRSAASKFLLYIVLGICVMAMGAFGISGIFSQSTSATVATVGDETVDADDYYRGIQNEISMVSQQFGTAITIDQAIAFGLDQSVLQRLVQEAAFRGEANRFGVSVSDETVREILLSTRGFQGLDGNFDAAVYQDALARAGLSTTEYEDLLRSDSSQQIMVDSVIAGVELPDEAIRPIFDYLGENRAFNYVRLDANNIIGAIPEPTQEQMAAYYEENPDNFTIPLIREVTYSAMIPSEMADQMEVPAEEVQALYDSRADEYSTPEKRFVERIVFGNLDEANDAVMRIVAGDATFDSIAQERGLVLAALDLGDVTRGDLSKEAADLLFETTDPGVYGPARDDIGPAIYRVNAALDAQIIPLDEVYEELEREVAIELALAQVGADIDRIIDLVAGGATPEELSDSTDMVLGSLEWAEGDTDGIAAYTEFRDEAKAAEIGEERDLIELPDGGLLLLRVDAITEPTLRPIEDVQEDLHAAVLAQNTQVKIRQRADQIVAAIAGSGGTLVDFANNLELEFVGDVARTSSLADLPAGTVEAIYELETGGTAILEDSQSVVVVELWSATPFDPTDPESITAVVAVSSERNDQLAEDVLSYFGRALVTGAEPTFNQSRLDALHQQLR